MLDQIVKLLTSLKLTVACLVGAMILVFVGTLAQVELGLYETQERYFRSFLVFWSPGDGDMKIPILPGGYLLGWVLLINLVGAHAKRFSVTKKKIGILLVHSGLIVLLLGQFFTELFQVESYMRIHEGQTKNFTEIDRVSELAFVHKSFDDKQDRVIAIPQSVLRTGDTIQHEALPFAVKIAGYFPNSVPGIGAPKESGPDLISAANGVGQSAYFRKEPITRSMNSRNIPAAKIEIQTKDGKSSSWIISNWLVEDPLVRHVASQFGQRWQTLVEQPQEIEVDGETYQVALRPKRLYKDYSIELVDFRHDVYKGTDIPKNFSSQIQLKNPRTQEDREFKIFMNNPLRYGGETYYQAGYDDQDASITILQVVRNPSWLMPYISCVLVGVGLMLHFGIHLFKFLKRKAA